MTKAPGNAYREGVSVMELAELFPTDDAAREWFEVKIWASGRHCPRCGCTETVECKGTPPMPYWCPGCTRHFSVRIGTVMEGSPLPLRKWVWAIHLHLMNLKGMSSMKLHRDLKVTQKTAWFMLQRIREAFRRDDEPPMDGPVEVDEIYMGVLCKRMPNTKRRTLEGRGAVGKEIVGGVKDREMKEVRACHMQDADTPSLAGFAVRNARRGVTVYTDSVDVDEDLRQQAHTNGTESLWSMLRRVHKGVHHNFPPKHLHRYIAGSAGRHNIRESGMLRQMVASLAAGMADKRLTYAALIEGNGRAGGVRVA